MGLSMRQDANVLAGLLSDSQVTRSTLPTALGIYDKLRVAEGRRIIQGSRYTGFVYEFNGPMGDDLSAIAQAVKKQTSWIANTDPEDDVKEAVRMLRASGH